MIIIFVFIFIALFFFAGKYLDITNKPIKSDLIVCLGGNYSKNNRIHKSISLYNKGYSKEKLLLLTGQTDAYKKYVMKYYPETQYIVSPHYSSTGQEIQFLKQYMAEHHYKSVIIVSDPYHARRIKILTDLISVKNDEKFSYVFVSSGVSWWDRNKYYQTPRALQSALGEILKISYAYFYYGFLVKLGITLNESEYLELKSIYNVYMWHMWRLLKDND